MKALSELFVVAYGSKLDLNKMVLFSKRDGGINFVGRSTENHGVSATVAEVPGITPCEAGLITVALGGTKLLCSFVQEERFYTAQNVAVLTPRNDMTFHEKVFACLCIRHNRFRYSAFGREANRSLRSLIIPEPSEFPDWVKAQAVNAEQSFEAPAVAGADITLDPSEWRPFAYEELFDIERGTGPRRKDLDGSGNTPVVTSTDSNNGVTGRTSHAPCHRGNTIGVNRNGSVGEAFYQPVPFCSTEDVHIFVPKFDLNPFVALFLTTLIRRERYRFGYGRKWGIERMKKTIVRLPVAEDGRPDWQFMEDFMKSLPFSSRV